MIETTEAVRRHKTAGLSYLGHLPTGGVMASWGSPGHITVAEPGAGLGFLGPRVFEALSGTPFPAGVQTPENPYRTGLIDAVVEPRNLPGTLGGALDIIIRARGAATPPILAAPPRKDTTAQPSNAWKSSLISRNLRRPDLR
jgi:acetyl-CoA carboxylase carboxyl transferase subunit beta